MKLSVIIPIYNEEKTLGLVLDKILAMELEGLEKEIILVDDFSQDTSREIAQSYAVKNPLLVKYFRLERNSGKGSALRRGFKEASGDFIVVQDADLEYDPDEIQDLLKPLRAGFADVVYGSRFTGAKLRRSLGFWHYCANKFLTYLANFLNGVYLTDMETCYKVFRKEIIQSIELQEKRFGIEPEITAKIAKIPGIRLYELPISYYGRDYSEGKKIKWTDGFKAIFYIFKYKFFD